MPIQVASPAGGAGSAQIKELGRGIECDSIDMHLGLGHGDLSLLG